MKIQRTDHTGRARGRRRKPCKAVSLAKTILADLKTPQSYEVLVDLAAGDYSRVVSASVDPSTYDSVDLFRRDYLAVSLLSKYPYFDLGRDLQHEALLKFRKGERDCSEAAAQLSRNVRSGSLKSARTLFSVLHTAREKIRSLLGPFSWDEAEPYFAFGPGATTGLKHCEGDPYFKLGAKPQTTYGCAMLSYTVLRRVPLWYNHVVTLSGRSSSDVDGMCLAERLDTLFDIVKGNRVTFVPKSATKLRTIAIEPAMNGYIQHGVGKVIEKRLRKAGVDLHDQTLNQEMARIGSSDGSLATLDLSAASDSVSLELCKQLLPEDWFDVICQIRSPVGTLPDGTVIRYSKVSSMGNGTTFALESLIFWAICAAVVSLFNSGDRRFTVYGDDIIVPTDCVHPVTWVLEACGFSLNHSKSYASGPFRESCGKHYFRGNDVTPFYVREHVDTTDRLFWLANQIRRWSRLTWGLDPLLRRSYDRTVDCLPIRRRNPTIPDGIGDYGLIGDLDEVRPSRAPDGTCGWLCRAIVPVIKTRVYGDELFLLRCLYSMGDRSNPLTHWAKLTCISVSGWRKKGIRLVDSSFGVVPRKRLTRRIGVTLTARDWPSYGPWLG